MIQEKWNLGAWFITHNNVSLATMTWNKRGFFNVFVEETKAIIKALEVAIDMQVKDLKIYIDNNTIVERFEKNK